MHCSSRRSRGTSSNVRLQLGDRIKDIFVKTKKLVDDFAKKKSNKVLKNLLSLIEEIVAEARKAVDPALVIFCWEAIEEVLHMLHDKYEKTNFKVISDVAKQIESDKGVCELWLMQQALMDEDVEETFEKNFETIRNHPAKKFMGARSVVHCQLDQIEEGYSPFIGDISSPLETPIQRLLREFRSAYNNLEIEKANRLVEEIDCLSRRAPQSFTEHVNYELSFRKTRNVYNKMQKSLALMKDNKNFREERLNEFTTVGWRKDPNSFLTFQLDTTIDGDLLPLATVVKETELFTQILSYVNETSVHQYLDKGNRIVVLGMRLPKPVSSRYGFVHCYGVNRLFVNDSVLFGACSVEEDMETQNLFKFTVPPPDRSKVRYEINACCAEMKQIGTKINIKACVTIDPKVFYIPDFIVALIARKLGGQIFDSLRKNLANYQGSQYEEIMKIRYPEDLAWMQEERERFLLKGTI